MQNIAKEYNCNTCGKTFAYRSKLKVHERSHNGERPYVCEICRKAFSQLGGLKSHERIHTGEKPHICEVCKEAFSHSCSLKAHERVHAGENLFVCKVCGKEFSYLHNLRVHERIHTGEKPYACDFCSKAFRQLGGLRSHERIHTEDKPYVCEICKKSFKMFGSLKDHERIHTGEKPHVCKFCARTFGQLSHLKVHERYHGGEQSYQSGLPGNYSHQGFVEDDQNFHTDKTSFISYAGIKAPCPSLMMTKPQRRKTGEKLCFSNTSKSSSFEVDFGETSVDKIVFDKQPKKTPFLVNPFGCGFCDEMFEEETEFRMHCSLHPDDSDFSFDLVFDSLYHEMLTSEVLKERFATSIVKVEPGIESVTKINSQRWFGPVKVENS